MALLLASLFRADSFSTLACKSTRACFPAARSRCADSSNLRALFVTRLNVHSRYDPRYAEDKGAYYEDTDMSFHVRQVLSNRDFRARSFIALAR